MVDAVGMDELVDGGTGIASADQLERGDCHLGGIGCGCGVHATIVPVDW